MKTRGNTRNVWRQVSVAAIALGAMGGGLLGPSEANAVEPGKEVTVTATSVQTHRVIWNPANARPPFGTRGPGCAQITASVANQFNNIDVGAEITLQAGMVEGEGFGSTYTVTDPVPGTPTVNEAFPVEVNLVEFWAGTAAALSGSNGLQVRLGWSIELWDGEPNVGTSSVVFSVTSDPDPGSTGLPGDLMLNRNSGACSELTVLLGGAPASAGKVQFSVDPAADPIDRMLVQGLATDAGGNRLNTFTVIVKIEVHHQPGATTCSSVNPCNNVFLATEGNSVNGSSNGSSPTFPTRNWLFAVACSGGAPAGYTRFSALGAFRPTHDVLQQVTYTPAFCAGAATGACCAGSGSCSVVTPGACSGTSVYQGDSTTCGAGTCPTGACCAVSGTCSATTPTGCNTGSFQGTGTICSPNPCPQPTGACCALVGTCSITTAAACGSGTFAGANTTCNAQSCPGACCIGSGCLTASLGDCGNVGGTYQGNASACVNSACPTGACCITTSGTCSISSPAACTSQGGNYGGNASVCNTTFCPLPTGACCATNGFCLASQTQTACQNVGFTWQGGGTVCSPNPCQQAGVCCRGATCTTGIAQASCTAPAAGIGAFFASASAACNATGVNTTPCCYADFNKAAGTTVQDIFDFLNAWFTSSPYCRLGGDGTGSPTVQDIFGFLSAWFAGC